MSEFIIGRRAVSRDASGSVTQHFYDQGNTDQYSISFVALCFYITLPKKRTQRSSYIASAEQQIGIQTSVRISAVLGV